MLSTDYRPLGILETLLMQVEMQAVAIEQQAKAIRLSIALLRGETSPEPSEPPSHAPTITTAHDWQPSDDIPSDGHDAMPPTFGG